MFVVLFSITKFLRGLAEIIALFSTPKPLDDPLFSPTVITSFYAFTRRENECCTPL